MEKKTKKITIAAIIVIILIIVLSVVPVIYPSICKDASQAVYSVTGIGPNLPMHLNYLPYPDAAGGDPWRWKEIKIKNLTDNDFARHPYINDLFSNINTSINKTESFEKRIDISTRYKRTSIPIISHMIGEQFRKEYTGYVLYWEGEYYIINMPYD